MDLGAMSLLEAEEHRSGRAAAGGRRLALLQALAALCEGLPHATLLRKTTQVRGAELPGRVHDLPAFSLLVYVQQRSYSRRLDSYWSVAFQGCVLFFLQFQITSLLCQYFRQHSN